MNRHSIYIPAEMMDRLKTIAKRKGIPYSEVVRRIIDDYIERVDSNEKVQ